MNELAEKVGASLTGVPDLGYRPAPAPFRLPPGMNFGLCSGVAVNCGGQGKAPHRYGEAHFLALDRKENIYVADTLNWRVQKLVRK